MSRELQRADDLNFGAVVDAAGKGALSFAKRLPVGAARLTLI